MNSVIYFEIQADDPERAEAFYTAVFGWKFARDPALPIPYWRISTEGINGGLLKRPAPPPPPMSGTNAYVNSMQVSNFDETAQKILNNGGRVALPKFAIPANAGRAIFSTWMGTHSGFSRKMRARHREDFMPSTRALSQYSINPQRGRHGDARTHQRLKALPFPRKDWFQGRSPWNPRRTRGQTIALVEAARKRFGD
jgi:predicted enzyme related to lactoylglutathione lyase